MKILQPIKNTFSLPITVGLPIVVGIVKTSTGLLATIASSLSFGKIKSINKAADLTCYSGKIVPIIIQRTAQVVHTDIEIDKNPPEALFSGITKNFFSNLIEDKVDNPKFLQREVKSRIYSLIQIPCLLISRIADLALGIVLLIGQLSKRFRDNDYNCEMAASLNLLATIDDIAKGIRGVVNPHQFSDNED